MATKKRTAAKRSVLGARARAKTLSIEERRASTKLSFAARRAMYRSSDGGPPKATHMGELRLGVESIPCAVLEDGTRVLSQRGVGSALGRKRGGRDWQPSNPAEKGGGKLPFFMAASNLKPFLSEDLLVAGNEPIFYVQGSAGVALGLRATALPKLCDAWLRAREAGALRADQLHIAQRAEILVRGLAIVGIEALVDECTGYQGDRPHNALSGILDAFIARELRPWAKLFPDEYFREIYRLKNWPYDPATSRRNQAVGSFTNDIVYERLAPGLLAELSAATPRNDSGRYMLHLHRQVSAKIGVPKMREHISKLLMLMRANVTWEGFLRQLDRSLPRFGRNYELGLGE